LLAAACGEGADSQTLGSASPVGEDTSQPEGDSSPAQISPTPEVKAIDLDLSVMSSTIVYAQVTNILTKPDDYLGKTIKARGKISSSRSDETGEYYHFIVFVDSSSCCEQGLEFIWNGEQDYPGNYPKDSTMIEVVGVYALYEEFDVTYCRLEIDELTVL